MHPSSECENVRLSAMAMADGEKGLVPRDVVERHLRSCSACRAEVDRMQFDLVWPLPAHRKQCVNTESLWPAIARQLSAAPTNVSRIPRSNSRNAAVFVTAASLLITVGALLQLTNEQAAYRETQRAIRPVRVAVAVSDAVLDLNPARDEEVGPIGRSFDAAAKADEIAIVSVKETFVRNGQRFLRMPIETLLKRRLTIAANRTSTPSVALECKHSTDLSVEWGDQLALYLDGDPSRGWTIASYRKLSDLDASWPAETARFCGILLACESDDPALRFRDLLLKDGELRLDPPAYFALMERACPHALPILRPAWNATVAQVIAIDGQADVGQRRAQHDVENCDSTPEDGGQQAIERPPTVSSAPPTPLLLARLLARMNDAESVQSVLSFALQRPPSERIKYLELIPDLCREADQETIREVHAAVRKLVPSLQAAELPDDTGENTEERTKEETEDDVRRTRDVANRLQKLMKSPDQPATSIHHDHESGEHE